MGDQLGGAAGGARGPPRRGYHVPDVRVLMGLLKSKDMPRNSQPGSGNPNFVQNMTPEELQNLFFEYLRSKGVPGEEFDTDFRVPIGDQGEPVNALNLRAQDIYRVWAGSRREFYFLYLMSLKDDSPQIAGDVKAILNAIELLKDELEDIFKQIKARDRVAYAIPEQLKKDMVIPKPEKAKKRRK